MVKHIIVLFTENEMRPSKKRTRSICVVCGCGVVVEVHRFFCFAASGPRCLDCVHGIIKSEDYQIILERNVGAQCQKAGSPEPRWPSGLRRWFTNAMHRGTGSRIPPLPRAEFGRLMLESHNWLVTLREAGGLSNLDSRIR